MTRFDLILLKKLTTYCVSLEFLHLGKVTSLNTVVPGHETNVLLIFKNPYLIAVSSETTQISKSKWLCSLWLSQESNTKVRNMGFLSDPDLDFQSHVTNVATLNYIIFTSEPEWTLIAHSASAWVGNLSINADLWSPWWPCLRCGLPLITGSPDERIMGL